MTVGIEFNPDGMPIEAPAQVPEVNPAPKVEALPEAQPAEVDGVAREGAEQAFAPPRGMWEYDLGSLDGATDQEVSESVEMRQALYEEKVPTFVVGIARQIADFNERGGPLDDAALEKARVDGLAELQKTHGAQAQDIIAKAKALFDRIDQRNPAIGDWLVATGVASSPRFIETLARLADVRR